MDNEATVPPSPRTEGDDLAFLLQKVSGLEQQLNSREANLEDQERKLRIDELRQRMQFRQFVLIISVFVMVTMGCRAAGGVHKGVVEASVLGVGFGNFLTVSSSYAIALFVAPVTSLTAITVALMLGTFRRFKDNDADSLATAAVEAGKAASGSM